MVCAGYDYFSSTFTKWLTLRTMPKIWGVASCSTGLWSFLMPSAAMVAFWRAGRLMALRTWVITIVAMVAELIR